MNVNKRFERCVPSLEPYPSFFLAAEKYEWQRPEKTANQDHGARKRHVPGGIISGHVSRECGDESCFGQRKSIADEADRLLLCDQLTCRKYHRKPSRARLKTIAAVKYAVSPRRVILKVRIPNVEKQQISINAAVVATIIMVILELTLLPTIRWLIRS